MSLHVYTLGVHSDLMQTDLIKKLAFSSLIITLSQFTAPALAGSEPGQTPGTLDINFLRDSRIKHFDEARNKTRQLYSEKNWLELEAFLSEKEKERAKSPDGDLGFSGSNTVGEIYSVLAMPAKIEDYPQQLKQLDEWQAAVPNSVHQPAVRGLVLVDWAWKARGNGFADTITEEGSKLFAQRLALARAVLEKAPQKGRPLVWYLTMLKVNLGEGVAPQQAEYDKVFSEAVKNYPNQVSPYSTKLYALLPRWYGDRGEWEKFAAASANKIGGINGDVLYTRLIIDVMRHYGQEMKDSPPDMARVERGMAELQKRYPDPTPTAVLCRIYYTLGNKEKARRLFNKIGPIVPKFAFDTKSQYLDFWKELHQS